MVFNENPDIELEECHEKILKCRNSLVKVGFSLLSQEQYGHPIL